MQTTDELTCPDPPQLGPPSVAGVGAFVSLVFCIAVTATVDWREIRLVVQLLLVLVLAVSAVYILIVAVLWVRKFWKTLKCRYAKHNLLSERLGEIQQQTIRLRQKRNDLNLLIANIGAGSARLESVPFHITSPHYRDGKLCFVIPNVATLSLLEGSTLVVYDRTTGEELAAVVVMGDRPGENAQIAELLMGEPVPPDQLFIQNAHESATSDKPYETTGIIYQRTFTTTPVDSQS